MSETFQIDQNQVKLSKIDNRLIIEIETHPAGKSFSIELDNDAIAQASNEVFADTESMYNGLKEALKKVYKEVSLTLYGNGKLEYKLSFAVGSVRKEHQFTLSLQEKKLSQITFVEKKLENLQKVVDNIERKHQEGLEKSNERISTENSKIVEMINKMETRICEKLDAFEKRIALLENKKDSAPLKELKSGKELCKSFNPNLPRSSGFIFSNDDKTIQWKKGKFELPILESLPLRGKVKISIVVEKMNSSFWIGLALVTRLQNDYWYATETRFMAQNGKIEKNSVTHDEKCEKNYSFKVGNTVTMVIDMNSGKVTFEVNNKEVNSIQIDPKTAYFPFCGFNSLDDQATLLSVHFED